MVEKPGLRAASGGKTAALEVVDSDRLDGVRRVFDRCSAFDSVYSVLVVAKTVPIPSLGDLLAAWRRSCGVTGHACSQAPFATLQLLVSRAPTISYGDLTVLI